MLRGLAVWLLIMLAETAHGVLRGLFVVPLVGDTAASRIGWPVGALIVMGMSLMMIRWTRLSDSRHLLALGGIWALLTGLFEIVIGLLRGFDAQRLWAETNPFSGGLMLYSVILMLLAPLIAARLRGADPAG